MGDSRFGVWRVKWIWGTGSRLAGPGRGLVRAEGRVIGDVDDRRRVGLYCDFGGWWSSRGFVLFLHGMDMIVWYGIAMREI
jgi:hypothetical protein